MRAFPTILASFTLIFLLAGCRAASTAPAPSSVARTPVAGMVHIPPGHFRMGTDDAFPYEGPAHEVEVAGFWMDQHEMTNDDFQRFVQATGYRTEAEKYGWSAVFDQQTGEWKRVDGADWQHPEGRGSHLRDRLKHPVVQVSWNDAVAYAQWARKRLPTEAEWEWAARGGLAQKTYAWGNELKPAGKLMANYWQGPWPVGNTGEDGYLGTAPVGSFPPNGFGLHDITGNVWEWTADWFAEDTYRRGEMRNPKGPAAGTERVIRGGSFLCNEHFCSGYRVAARNKNTPDSATNNMGFRCVQDGPPSTRGTV